jgi:Tol biopolymer transport system component
MRVRRLTGVVLAAAVLILPAIAPPPARASFPGVNGPISMIGVGTGPNGYGDVFTVQPDGTGLTNITSTPLEAERFTSFSPDGTKIAYMAGYYGIWVMNADGSSQRWLGGGAGEPTAPTWTPDGRVSWLGFIGCGPDDPTCDWYVWTANADGTEQTPQFTVPGWGPTGLAWSPDGSLVAIGRNEYGPAPDYQFPAFIDIRRADGSVVTSVNVGVHDQASPSSLSWSPDGSGIAFQFDGQIGTVRADGTGLRWVHEGGGVAWSPDGTRLAVADRDLLTMDPDGAAVTVVAPAPPYGYSDVSWGRSSMVYSFTGFFAPVDNATLNVAKAGSAIPVKFALGGDRGLDIFAAGYPRAVAVKCDTGEPADGVEEYVVATNSGLKYDAASGRYQYNWKTQKGVKGCYDLQLKLKDGSLHVADFQFK